MADIGKPVQLDRRGRVAVLTVDNPPVNALSHAVRLGLSEGLRAAAGDPAAAAIVIVCAGRTFIAGADITEFGKPPREPGLSDVLDLIGYQPRTRCGDQLRGPCPLHGSRSPSSRVFAAHLGKNVYHCFRCGAGGNALDLWAALTQQELHAAVLDLCQRLGRPIPWLPKRHRPKPPAAPPRQEKTIMPDP